MILLDLEKILIDLNAEINSHGIYLPQYILTTNVFLLNDNTFTNKSIFRILLLDERNINFTYKYKQIDKISSYLSTWIDTVYYIPDDNGDNVLNLTDNDIQFIQAVNNNDDYSNIEPDSEFLKVYKYDNYNPTTIIGNIVKFKKDMNLYVSLRNRTFTF